MSDLFDGRFASRIQHARPGSYAKIEAGDVRVAGALAVEALIWPTLPEDGPQTVISRRDPQSGAGFALVMTPEGMALETGSARIVTGKKLRARIWYRVWASIDPATGALRVGQQPLKRAHAADDEAEVSGNAPSPEINVARPLLIAAEEAKDKPAHRHFNGKIEAPRVAGMGAWDFSRRINSMDVEDTGPNALHGALVNLPTRAMKSSAWDGSERDWKKAPHHYAAIHFHDDDLHDCGWADDFSFTIPKEMKSGAYGMALSCGAHRDDHPVLRAAAEGQGDREGLLSCARPSPIRSTPTSRAAVFDDPFRKRVADWEAYPHNPDDHKDYGLSTYNHHRDGSGVAYSSRLRPLLTWRPDFLSFNDPKGSGLRHLPADTHLLAWFDKLGINVRHRDRSRSRRRGPELLAPYKVVVTGSHPEYHTAGTLDALQTLPRRPGGRLMYLGGNGFYWRVARSPEGRRAPSRCAAPKAASAPGPPSPASITIRSTAPMAACGAARTVRPISSAASASRARARSWAIPTAASPRAATIITPGCSRA